MSNEFSLSKDIDNWIILDKLKTLSVFLKTISGNFDDIVNIIYDDYANDGETEIDLDAIIKSYEGLEDNLNTIQGVFIPELRSECCCRKNKVENTIVC